MKLGKGFLHGFSQVMLQCNCYAGLLFMAGIAVNSLIMLAGAVAGNVIGQLTGLLLKGKRADIEQGLYGFNGVLVGVCVIYFVPLSSVAVFLFVAAAILSALLMHLCIKIGRFPAYTAPFILSAWLVLASSELLGLGGVPGSIDAGNINMNGFYDSVLLGVGQVMFQENIISGPLLSHSLI